MCNKEGQRGQKVSEERANHSVKLNVIGTLYLATGNVNIGKRF